MGISIGTNCTRPVVMVIYYVHPAIRRHTPYTRGLPPMFGPTGSYIGLMRSGFRIPVCDEGPSLGRGGRNERALPEDPLDARPCGARLDLLLRVIVVGQILDLLSPYSGASGSH